MTLSPSLIAGTFLLFSTPLLMGQASDWDSNDDTFDPAIPSVMIKGYSRTGDPTPFYKDGIASVQSYTATEAKPDDNLGAVVWLSLDVPFVPGQTDPQEGGYLILSVAQTEDLITHLKEAVENAEEERDLGDLFPEGSFDKWTVAVEPREDGGPIVLRRNREDEIDQFRFELNPTRKLIETLQHFQKEATRLASGSE